MEQELSRDLDDSPEVLALFSRLQESMPKLQALLAECAESGAVEEGVYRVYHQSFKCFALPSWTSRIVFALRELSPDRPLNPWFEQIVEQGTGLKFELEHNRRWLEVTRPILEAFFHARHFLETA